MKKLIVILVLCIILFIGTGYSKLPIRSEVEQFMAENAISQREFDVDSFTCVEFSYYTAVAAQRAGFQVAIVVLHFEPDYRSERGELVMAKHMVIAFATSDDGIVFIEPQTDKVIKPEVGHTYTLSHSPVLEIIMFWGE